MLITVKCKCGKSFRVDESMIGDTIHCMSCSKPVLVTRPAGSKTMPLPRPAPPTAAIKPAAPVDDHFKPKPPPAEFLTPRPPELADEPEEAPPPPPSQASIRDYVYWIIVLAFIPLALSLGEPNPPSFEDRVERTIMNMPENVQQDAREVLDDLKHGYDDDVDKLFKMLPGQRLEGASYSRFSSVHWLFAMVTVLIFATLLGACFSTGSVPVWHLVGIGLFTATIGVGILLFVHLTPIGLVLAVMEFNAGEGKGNFWAILMFMTLGVGMVEEACKAMAILGYLKGRPHIGWRQACLCGLATGVGFGVSEGIMYSSVFYNGVESDMMYLVRFASCVSLHAIWSASAAVTLYHSQDLFLFMQEEGAKEELPFENMTDELMQKFGSILARYGMVILRMVWLVMILHGLYNTALTVEMNLLALLTAIASFAYLAWQIEECRRLEAENLAAEATE